MKRLRADDSAGSRVKVGHRQALMLKRPARAGRFLLSLQSVGRVGRAKKRGSAVKTVLEYKASLIVARFED